MLHSKAEPSDADLLIAFENGELSREQWTHRAHVRVAFLYASRGDFHDAVSRMKSGLLALNAVLGTPNSLNRGYHETITVAFMRLIYHARGGQLTSSSADFCERHPELMSMDVLARHYSRERIWSCEAKRTFIEPDLAPLPVLPQCRFGFKSQGAAAGTE